MSLSKRTDYLILGLGLTGKSCVRFLKSKGFTVRVHDTRDEPPGLAEFVEAFPDVIVSTGDLQHAPLSQVHSIVISPGLSPEHPSLLAAREQGTPIIGDIELFFQYVDVPVVGITGSNGKSTVTALLGQMIKDAGKKVGVGGNLGTPILELLSQEYHDIFVVELSSFQLETTYSQHCYVACMLNLTPDHLDRHGTLENYQKAKQRVYMNSRYQVFNADDELTVPLALGSDYISFTANEPQEKQFGLQQHNGATYLACGEQRLLACDELKICGTHNAVNALAALALGHYCQLSLQSMLNTLKNFPGLAHRCQYVTEHAGVSWYNDSKASNVGAFTAAITGIGRGFEGRLIVIAGGRGKDTDYALLKPVVSEQVAHMFLMGEDADKMQSELQNATEITRVSSMKEAVQLASEFAKRGDRILLAPACTSWDMYKNYEQRGDDFITAVRSLVER